jgi:hypothetical protein
MESKTEEIESRIGDRGDRKQRILTKLALFFLQRTCSRQKAESATEETERRKY